jgi:hypothetical protein
VPGSGTCAYQKARTTDSLGFHRRIRVQLVMPVVASVLLALRSLPRSRTSLHLEILALRHQLRVLERSRRPRVRLTVFDRLLWVWLSRIWTEWRAALVLVKPETVVAWHHRGFRLFWTWKSRRRTGRPSVPVDVRALIRTMSDANPLLGCASDPWRAAETRHHREPVHGREVHEPAPAVTIAELADVLGESPRAGRGRGLLRGPNGHVSAAVRSRSAGSRPPTRRTRRRHRAPDLGVDGAATAQRLSLRRMPILPAA